MNPVNDIATEIPVTETSTILVVSSEVSLRHWVKDNFGDKYEIAVCTRLMDFTAELKWADRIKMIMLDFHDESFDVWEIAQIIETTHPSLPVIFLTQNEAATDEILQRAPYKKIVALYQPLEIARTKINEVLLQSERLEQSAGGAIEDADKKLNLSGEIERLQINVAGLTNMSRLIELWAKQSGFDSISRLRRLNTHLENIQGEWENIG